jgi:hypothetical protein
MSKRVLILLAGGILAIVAGFLLLKYELSKQEPEEEPEEEPEPDETLQTEKFTGFKKGFKWDKIEKRYKPVMEQEPSAIITPIPDNLMPG